MHLHRLCRCSSCRIPQCVPATATTGHIPSEFVPAIKGQWTFAAVKSVLPDSLSEAFIEGMEQFGHRIPGFEDANAVVSGIERRTSSPVRIVRDETLQANIRGVYPCGEGAGYAGGITSAAMDGMKVAEANIKTFSATDRV